MTEEFNLQCPIPVSQHSKIVLAHGGGGRLMNDLIEKFFVAGFESSVLNRRHDAAVLPLGQSRLAFTTDSYVVRPVFFPGGDIGSLAVNGTVDDLAMVGARPLFLSAGFISGGGFSDGEPMACRSINEAVGTRCRG
jgi:hydrogenase expression/formation protein HypE